jgi:hypothetical protein
MQLQKLFSCHKTYSKQQSFSELRSHTFLV